MSRYEDIQQHARHLLDEQVEKVKAAGATVAGAHLEMGRSDEEIAVLAEELEAGLIAVGSRGLGGLRRALMGSVSGSVVRHAHCSVLVVRESDGGGELSRKILLAFDGSMEAQQAARTAVEIAGAADSELHVCGY